jgi:CubicO group peptidase (beta-lactamase class C family)
MTAEEALSWEPVIEALENQKPSWEPGTQHGYHATTFGWLVGEVVKRITGTSLGTTFHDQVAAPLDLDFWIGLPESEEARVSTLISMIPKSVSGEGGDGGEPNQMAELMAAFMGPDTPLGKALFAPGGALADEDIWNSRAMHAAEVPAANGICDARSLARMYGATVAEVDGVRLLTPEQVTKAATQLTEGPNTILLGMEIEFGLGFMLNTGMIGQIGLGGPKAFGHFGAGGSVGWADPDAELGVGYVMNRMDIGLAGTRAASTWSRLLRRPEVR